MPQSAGWFVVFARESRWLHSELGEYCGFEGQDEAQFDQVGINLNVLPPGTPMAMYHEEPGQEDFLVLRGECLLIVEGEEQPLVQWDFFHCPPRTKHVIVAPARSPPSCWASEHEKAKRHTRSTRPRRVSTPASKR